ncbi:MAG: TonB family protein [Acidobacteria bacterium]|nr:TonB family protein [Acidobacteriota bacterium]
MKQALIVTLLLILTAGVSFFGRVQAGFQERSTEQPSVIKAVAPVFPLIAVTANVSGCVVIEVEITPSGTVTSAHIVDGHSLFRQGRVYEKVARQWRFTPADENMGIRTAKITFFFKIMPRNTPVEELTPIFLPPYQIEIRHEQPKPEVEQIPKGQVRKTNQYRKQNTHW